MKPISALFQKYQATLTPPQASVEKQTVAAIEHTTGIVLKPEQVTYQPTTKTLTLSVPSVVKSELLQRKKIILQALQTTLGPKHTPTELL